MNKGSNSKQRPGDLEERREGKGRKEDGQGQDVDNLEET